MIFSLLPTVFQEVLATRTFRKYSMAVSFPVKSDYGRRYPLWFGLYGVGRKKISQGTYIR